ncbi:carbohydrate-binding family 9-like protein [Salinimicrobium tongyeongense]|uniref:Carbohydrate-binding family 9-like protein n=1 Tax=Salinimicrobium tongyeongense TaxID=2809707 RepID=A0ABY6NUU7_9FLAO|nr:carbohydrate-binding family 9-like protein [Salinimicrobium tongyeongense]UZH56691.1 carbohydrate-binding family 9-like protein [Salinimicrobium tongyeongense]
MKSRYLLLLIFLLLSYINFSQTGGVPKSYIAYETIDAIHIDGKADEKSWNEAVFSDEFVDIEGYKKPKFQTRMKMLYDDTYLYFYAKMEEPHIWGTLKQRDTVIFYNNDFEIFIDPDGDTHNYLEFEVNALNTVWDLFISKPYREPGHIVDSWDIQGLKSAVFIKGSLNNPTDEDAFWSVEVAIPWDVLTEANTHTGIPKNEFWRINFSRVNWDHEIQDNTYSRKKDKEGNYLPEYNWVWSPQHVINMHEPEKWGYVYFSEKAVGEVDEFVIPEEEHIKWWLYNLYRKQKNYFQKNGKWAPNLKALSTSLPSLNGFHFNPTYEQHLSGWNISVKSPYSDDILLIKEDGKFVKL